MLGPVRQLVMALLAEWRKQADIEQLSALSDDLLADLGLCRGQIFQLGKREPGKAEGQQTLPKPEPWPELLPCG